MKVKAPKEKATRNYSGTTQHKWGHKKAAHMGG
jgi:hypothetical protein